MTTLVAFDFGLRHIGVAVGQSVTRTATPLATIAAKRGTPDWTTLDALVREWQPARLVVGLPLNMDGTESEMSRAARRFARALERRFGLPVALCDERLSSVEARTLAADAATSHAIAARLIAETFLQQP